MPKNKIQKQIDRTIKLERMQNTSQRNVSMQYQGPLPPSAEFGKYEDILPGAAR